MILGRIGKANNKLWQHKIFDKIRFDSRALAVYSILKKKGFLVLHFDTKC